MSEEMTHLVSHVQGTNPIYNLLPDILSSLSAEPGLPSAHFQVALPRFAHLRGAAGLAFKRVHNLAGPTLKMPSELRSCPCRP